MFMTNTFLEDSCPVYFDDCLVGILVLLAIAHVEISAPGSALEYVLFHNPPVRCRQVVRKRKQGSQHADFKGRPGHLNFSIAGVFVMARKACVAPLCYFVYVQSSAPDISLLNLSGLSST